MEATDGRRVGAAGRGRQLLGAPADVPVALFLPAESSFQPGSRRRPVSVPRAQRAAARPAETSGAPHPHPRTPGRQRAAPAAAPAGRRPPARRAASVKRPPRPGAPRPGAPRPPLPPASRRARGFSTLCQGPLSGSPWRLSQRTPEGQMPSLLRPGPSLPNRSRRPRSRPLRPGPTSTRGCTYITPCPPVGSPRRLRAPLGGRRGRPPCCTRSRIPLHPPAVHQPPSTHP